MCTTLCEKISGNFLSPGGIQYGPGGDGGKQRNFCFQCQTLKEAGWKEVYEVSAPKQDEELTEAPIHLLVKNEAVEAKDFELEEKETKPPSDIPMVH